MNRQNELTTATSMELVKRFGRQNIFVERWHGDCSVEKPHGAGIRKEQLLRDLDHKLFSFGDGKVRPRDVAGKHTAGLLKKLDEKISFAPDFGSKLPNHFAAASLCQEMNFRRSP